MYSKKTHARFVTHQAEDASGSSLILSTLGEEKQTLASLASPSGNGVGDNGFLILVEDGEVLSLDRLVAEVEEALGEAKAPVKFIALDASKKERNGESLT